MIRRFATYEVMNKPNAQASAGLTQPSGLLRKLRHQKGRIHGDC